MHLLYGGEYELKSEAGQKWLCPFCLFPSVIIDSKVNLLLKIRRCKQWGRTTDRGYRIYALLHELIALAVNASPGAGKI